MTAYATAMFWCASCGVLFGAFLALVGWLTDNEDVRVTTRTNRGGGAEPSSDPTVKQSHIAHDRNGQ
jgi:hypothetical protein